MRQANGNGLGLSICKKICEQLEGIIYVESKQYYGSTFTFHMRIWDTLEEDNDMRPDRE